MLKILTAYGIPEQLVDAIASTYTGTPKYSHQMGKPSYLRYKLEFCRVKHLLHIFL